MGDVKHIEDETCWCEPELIHVDPDTGIQVWLHKDTTEEGLH
jgi:hypothetical protein